MPEMLLLNPRRRRRSAAKKTRRARRRNPVAAVARRVRRRRNPIAAVAKRRSYRRRNPIALRRASRRVSRRRRNPIALRGLSASGIIKTLMDAGVMGVGAIGVDVAWSKLNAVLPATLQQVPGRLTVGDAVKAVGVAVLGALLNRPTRGLAGKAAIGSLIVQARDAVAKAFPQVGMQAAGLGYYTPGAVIPASARIGPNRALNNNGAGQRVAAYLPPGTTPLLNGARSSGLRAYVRPGVTALLNARGSGGSASREGFRHR